MEHLVALSQELLSTPGKASKQQVRPRGPAPSPSHPSAQTKQVSPGSGEPLPSPSHGNGIHLRADRAPGFPSSRPRLRYPRVSGRMEGAEEQALPRGPAFPSKAHPSALHPIAQSCTGGLRGPGVLLPAGDAEESRSPEQPEQPRAWPALSRCGSIPRPRSPEHMLLGLLGLQLGPGSELAGSPGSNKPLCLSVASLIPRWHCPVVLSSAPTADREEWEQEAQVMLGMQKVLQSLGRVAEKLRQAAGWLWGQEEEMRLQWSRNQSPQVWSRARKVRLRG